MKERRRALAGKSFSERSYAAPQGREKKIVNLRFFEGKTQTEVSTEIGISQAQVSRLEKSALQHMRKFM